MSDTNPDLIAPSGVASTPSTSCPNNSASVKRANTMRSPDAEENDSASVKRTNTMRSPDAEDDVIKKSKGNDDNDSDLSDFSEDQNQLPPGKSNGIPCELKPLMLDAVGPHQVSNTDSLLTDSPDRRDRSTVPTVHTVNGRPIPNFMAMDTESPR